MNRRRACAVLVGAAALAAGIGAGDATASPEAIKMLIPANPGGGWDQTARALGAAMQSAGLAKQVQYDNRGGAGGTIGLAQFVNSAKGDPAQLMVAGLVMVGAIELQKSPISLAQVTPIARLTAESEAIVVPAGSKFRTLGDLLAQFKANPASVSWGGGSAGGTDHILVGLIAKAVGADSARINYVPFKGGGEALQAILGGHVSAGVSGYGEFAEQVRAGKLRVLAVSGGARVSGLDAPTLKEQGIAVDLTNWRGVFAAPGLTDAQRQDLVKLVLATVKTPAWQETLRKMDWNDVLLTGEDFGNFVAAESQRVGAVLREIGLAK
jgi:putative tricarboxylic transport membrane protein